MAIKVNGTTVINDSRSLTNIASVDATTVAALGAAGVGGSPVQQYTLATLPTPTSAILGKLAWVTNPTEVREEFRVVVETLIPTGIRTIFSGNFWNQTYFTNTGFVPLPSRALSTDYGVEMSTSGNGRSTDGKEKQIRGYFNRGMNGTAALTDVSTGNATYTLPANGSWVDLGNYSGSQFVGKSDSAPFIKEVVTTAFLEYSWATIRSDVLG